jgi:hypothetical protein
VSKFNLLGELYEMRVVFPDVYNFYAAIETFGCSTAVCKASFSALAAINVTSRLSMTNERMRRLAYLAFENKRLKNIPVDDVLREFNKKKQRKVQLF